jgi:hypothetical protein
MAPVVLSWRDAPDRLTGTASPPLLSKESCNEGASFSKKDLPELQDCSTQGRGLRHLYGQETQAKTRLKQITFK